MDQVARRHGQVGADLLDEAEQLVLDDQRRGLRILDDVAHVGAGEPEVDRQRDQPGLGRGGEDLQPLDAVVGEDGDAIALGQPQPQQRVAKTAGTLVPLPEAHHPLEIARAGRLAQHASVYRQHLTDGQQLFH